MSTKSFFATIGFLLFSILNLTAQNIWEILNPRQSGNTSEIVQLDFLSENTAYALAGNEFLKTTDAGNTWVNIGAPLLNNKTLQFSFVNENTGYCIAGGETGTPVTSGYVYKTINGGINWTRTNYGTGVHSDNLLSIYFTDENTGYLSGGGDQNSVYKTTDGGNTWELISNLTFVQMQFLNVQVGYGRTNNSIYRTTDGGKNWAISFTHDNKINSFHFRDEKNGYWTGDAAILYSTHNGGITWNKITIPEGNYSDVRYYSNNTGYILDISGNLYKTSTGGANWVKIYSVPGLSSVNLYGDNIYLSGSGGKILKSKIEIPLIYMQLNQAEKVTNHSATISGYVASNQGKIENIRFELTTRSASIVIPAEPVSVYPDSASKITANLKDLLSNTFYSYKLKATQNGIENTYSGGYGFETYPDLELKILDVSSSSNDAAVSGRVISYEGPLTNIEFQYSIDTTFSSKISATPGSVEEGIMTSVRGNLSSLKAETNFYHVRIKAAHNGKISYSPKYSFRTFQEYIFYFFDPVVSGTNVTIQADVAANKDTIRNIVLEYGTSHSFGRKVTANPSVINKSQLSNLPYSTAGTRISTQILNLDPDSIYFYRLKATTDTEIIYSRENILSLKGGIIMIPLKEEKKSNISVTLNGMINTNGKYLENIYFQYGRYPGSFTDSVKAGILDETYNEYSYTGTIFGGYTTKAVSVPLSNLEPGKEYHFRIRGSEGSNRYYSEELRFSMGVITGFESTIDYQEVIVYPNPTSGILNIRSPYSVTRIQLLDLYGKTLFLDKDQPYLDLSPYPRGLYILKIFIDDKIIVRKIIKS